MKKKISLEEDENTVYFYATLMYSYLGNDFSEGTNTIIFSGFEGDENKYFTASWKADFTFEGSIDLKDMT